MATYKDLLIDVSIQGSVLEVMPSEFSFSMRDSVHSLFPRATLELDDTTGLFHEYQLLIEGAPLELSYGYEEDFIKNYYVVERTENPTPGVQGSISGAYVGRLVHRWAHLQELKSEAIKGPASSVVGTLLGSIEFKQKTIQASLNAGTWYRPMVSQQDMIERILLPRTFSQDADKTPYFCFIDSKNGFWFTSFAKLWAQVPLADLEYKAVGSTGFNRYSVQDLKPFSPGDENVRPTLGRRLFALNDQDGTFADELDPITDHPKQGSMSMPLLGDGALVTGYDYPGYFRPNDKFDQDNLNGLKLNGVRNGLMLERLYATLPLNPQLTAGATVNVKTYLYSQDGVQLSLYYSSKYLIESSDHVWNGQSQTGHTNLLLARNRVKLPSSYLIKDKTWQA